MTTIQTKDTRLLGTDPDVFTDVFTDVFPGGPIYGKLDLSPTAVDGYEATREVATLAHPVIGKQTPLITIRAGGLRTGTLTLWYDDEALSATSEIEHARGTVMELLSDSATLDMYYLAAGKVQRRLDASRAWVVAVDFIEVNAILSRADMSAAFPTRAAFNAAFSSRAEAANAWEYIGTAVT